MAAQVNAPLFDVVASGGSNLLCNNSTLTLEVVNPNFSNATYLWSNGDVGPTTTISTIGDYSLYVTDNSFACHTTMSDTIRIIPPMAAPSILCSADTVCVGDFVELSSLSNEQTNWYTDAAGINLVSTDSSLYFFSNALCCFSNLSAVLLSVSVSYTHLTLPTKA